MRNGWFVAWFIFCLLFGLAGTAFIGWAIYRFVEAYT